MIAHPTSYSPKFQAFDGTFGHSLAIFTKIFNTAMMKREENDTSEFL